MKKVCIILLIFLLCLSIKIKAQVAIGDNKEPQKFSILELHSKGEKGLRIAQLTTDQRDKLTDSIAFQREAEKKAKGLIIYNLTNKCLEYWNGKKWIAL